MQKLVVASGNKGKIREIKALLGDKYEVVSMGELGITVEVEETGTTFLENAIIKAKAIYNLCSLPVVSDDSGLIVDALGGEPGVYSARYAGEPSNDENNNAKLLKNLEDKTDRTARFVSSVVFYDGVNTISADGVVEGEILKEKQGKNGFGYDPLFFCYDLNKSFGVATQDEKGTVSHRARAFSALKEKICKVFW